jgi:hypothetical protein
MTTSNHTVPEPTYCIRKVFVTPYRRLQDGQLQAPTSRA